MRVLIIGSGGREHALVWKIKQSPRVDEIWCCPGNAGIREIAETADMKDNNVPGLVTLAREIQADLTVVGPEAPLAIGIVDAFQREGLRIFGPRKRAAELESSKTFAKRLMKARGIPTAEFEEFDDSEQAIDYLKTKETPIVVKADGLAAGKGVIVAQSREEAETAVHAVMKQKAFGDAGRRIIIEEFLEGQEVTIMIFAAGTEFFAMPPAQDHKPVFDNDQGPNTGGMGCYSPVPAVTPDIQRETEEKIIGPMLQAMAADGRTNFGILSDGLMLTKDGPKVVEFNCRFGDPEAEVILPKLESDLVDLLEPIANGGICDAPRWSDRAATCVVMASGGYPGKYDIGKEIAGIEAASQLEDVIVFHAATRKLHRRFQTNGGRVLAVVGLGDDLKQSVDQAYAAVNRIAWEGMHYRSDIARKAMNITSTS